MTCYRGYSIKKDYKGVNKKNYRGKPKMIYITGDKDLLTLLIIGDKLPQFIRGKVDITIFIRLLNGY